MPCDAGSCKEKLLNASLLQEDDVPEIICDIAEESTLKGHVAYRFGLWILVLGFRRRIFASKTSLHSYGTNPNHPLQNPPKYCLVPTFG